MTGLSTLLVELDDGSGTFPYDITEYADLRASWNITRGRQDELDGVDPSQLRLTLNNNDGRFTLGSAAYGIVVDQKLRVTETFGATTSKRITGYVQDWPVVWSDPHAANSPCAITVVSRQARWNRRKLRSSLESSILADSPLAFWPLQETVGATVAYNVVPGDPSPRLVLNGSGVSPTFGVSTEDPQVPTGVQFNGGKYLLSEEFLQTTTGVTVEAYCAFPTAPPTGVTQVLLVVGRRGAEAPVYFKDTGGLGLAGGSSATVVANGLHQVVVEYDPDGSKLWVDGVLAESYASSFGPPLDSSVRVLLSKSGNDSGSIAELNGTTIGYVAVYDGTVGAQVAARPRSGQPVESSDARVTRIAAYAGVAPSELALEAGVLRDAPAQSLTGASVASAVSEIVFSEGGAWFDDGDGKTVMQNRSHRIHSATRPPVVTLTSGDIEHDDARVPTDKQYLQNEVSGTRINGSQITMINKASQDQYDQYPADLGTLIVQTDDEVRARAEWQVSNYAQPLPRMNSVTIDLLTLDDDAKVEALLALELGDRIVIDDLPPQSPLASADLLVEGSSEEGSHQSWRLTLNTVSAALFRAWVLDDETYGVLGVTTRLHF